MGHARAYLTFDILRLGCAMLSHCWHGWFWHFDLRCFWLDRPVVSSREARRRIMMNYLNFDVKYQMPSCTCCLCCVWIGVLGLLHIFPVLECGHASIIDDFPDCSLGELHPWKDQHYWHWRQDHLASKAEQAVQPLQRGTATLHSTCSVNVWSAVQRLRHTQPPRDSKDFSSTSCCNSLICTTDHCDTCRKLPACPCLTLANMWTRQVSSCAVYCILYPSLISLMALQVTWSGFM